MSKKKTNKPRQLYLPLQGVLCSRKAIKKLLLTIGFHHSWGHYIRNSNKQHRINVGKTHIELTKRGNYYDHEIPFKDKTNEEVQTKILRYFITSGDTKQ
jgi:hypothetical protein